MKLFLEDYDKYKKELPAELFSKIENLNPTVREKGITEWLIKQYLKNKENFFSYSDKITLSLSRFDKLKRTNKLQEKDINKYDLGKLFSITKEEVKSAKEEKKEDLTGANKLYEDNTWLALQPTTYESACKYGAGSKWCTASIKDRKNYDSYTKHGYLLFLLNKKNPAEKYSMHRDLTSFVDAPDNEMSVIKIKALLEKLPEKLVDIIKKHGVDLEYRQIRNKLLLEKLSSEDINKLNTISNYLKNKLLTTVIASSVFNNEEICHYNFREIAKKTETISKTTMVSASLSDDSFYTKIIKSI